MGEYMVNTEFVSSPRVHEGGTAFDLLIGNEQEAYLTSMPLLDFQRLLDSGKMFVSLGDLTKVE